MYIWSKGFEDIRFYPLHGLNDWLFCKRIQSRYVAGSCETNESFRDHKSNKIHSHTYYRSCGDNHHLWKLTNDILDSCLSQLQPYSLAKLPFLYQDCKVCLHDLLIYIFYKLVFYIQDIQFYLKIVLSDRWLSRNQAKDTTFYYPYL